MALKSVEEINPMSIREKILEISEFEGLQRKINVDQFGGIFRDVLIYKVEEGAFVRADEK